ncbi:uncharacterized protein BO95DRAFT_451691 [Aspergillus brunneoviolaceus CBS 621.78]|uniref:Uncharacterized protein n=1 Tax=Aspergillus brunneoviolaceus CBS 621.78 TaxID=1450534 RepID=A0ACD1GE02_9EURO|nr:hypothetical protein BO95DRAFT_451691 [Aspergillus brunneoviolaceus CBS 621.78]RAH47498.1 hypothetical protein BO95DRAFT_451691 [Aspergillus brunneoviolaceus CBS 621.78]
MEAIVYGKKFKKDQFPKIITCPHEMVALLIADRFTRLTGKPQAVIVHVNVGTQALGCVVHNTSAAYCPYMHWLQDAKKQRQIIRTRKNIKQMISRAMQPVYLTAGREKAISPTALLENGVEMIATLLVHAQRPLIIVGHSGRDHQALPALVDLVDMMPGLRVLDCLGSDVSFSFTHPAFLGLGIGAHKAIPTADFILVVHAAVPWIPYINASKTYRTDTTTAFRQLQSYIASNKGFTPILASAEYLNRGAATKNAYHKRLAALALAATDLKNLLALINSYYLGRCLHTPGHLVNCSAGGLGWSGGATLGVKLASDYLIDGNSKGKFICEIVGNRTYIFDAPETVYWIARQYYLATLTIVLSNNKWNVSRNSLELVYPAGLELQVNNLNLNISFSPTPDYAGIAKAAAGHHAWAGVAGNTEQFEQLLPQAVESMKKGVLTVLKIRLSKSWQAAELVSQL